MKKLLLFVLMLMVVIPLNVYALSATPLFEFQGIGGNTYQITLSLNNASEVTGYTSTIVLPEGALVNDDIVCSDGSTCSIVENVITVTNENGLSGYMCTFTVEAAERVLDMNFQDSAVTDASGNTKSIYNPSTDAAYANGGNPSTGIIGVLSLSSLLVIATIILLNVYKKNKFANI